MKFDLGSFANGILGGLVGITAGCASLDTTAAVFVGACAGAIVFLVTLAFDRIGFATPYFRVDDPVGAFAVHGACGAWGVLAVGLFDLENGLLYGSGADAVLLPNIYGIVAITVWVSLTSIPTLLILKYAGLLRVSEDVEKAGLDKKMVPQAAESIASPDKKTMSEIEQIASSDNTVGKPVAETEVTDVPVQGNAV